MGGNARVEGQNIGSMTTHVQSLIESNPVLVMATSTCPFCIEAKRTLMAHGFNGRFVDMDQEADTAEMRKAMAGLAGNRTSVPQIWINKEHVGGCDSLKALDAAGDLGLKLEGLPRHSNGAEAEAGASVSKTSGVSSDSAAINIYPGPDAAYFSSFHAATTVDNRVVRMNGVMTFFIAAATAVFAGRMVTEWVVLGLTLDFGLKLTGFPSPVSLLGALPFAGTKPQFTPGASKQFANLCGIFMAVVAWACLLGDKPLGATIVLVMLAGAAFLQGFVNFCAGCFIFKYLLKWGIVSHAVYRMHVNTRADRVYAWEMHNIRTGKEFAPATITYRTMGLPPNPTDLRAKPEKEDDKWERFHLIKYCHVGFFMIPLSTLGLALPWALLSHSVGTSRAVWQTLAWTGAVFQVTFLSLFLAKCVLYPSKVRKEWYHPLRRNSFALPFLNLILLSWLSTQWTGASGNGDLARVLYWLGTVPLVMMMILMVSSWISIPGDEEFVNPSWMIIPVGNLMGAVVTKAVDPDYIEWGWFMFGAGVFLWLALWPITFRKAIFDHHSDFRLRSMYSVWIAPPAVAMIAYTNLAGVTEFDSVQRMLFYASLSMALVLASCAWPFNFFLEGEFDMSAWAFAFPLDALAAASVVVYSYTRYDAMQVIYVVALSAACVVNAGNMLSTLAALKGKHMFSPPGKWGPPSFLKLTHEALREALPKLQKLVALAKPGSADVSSLHEFAAAWSAMAKAHSINAKHEDEILFPILEGFFPGQTHRASADHKKQRELAAIVQATIDALLNGTGAGGDEAGRVKLVGALKADVYEFGRDVMDHMDREEHAYAAPVARKFLCLKTSKDIARQSWDAIPNPEMSEFLAWVMATLRTRGQRTKFLKAWVWAMPERGQQLGLMVYRVVDDVTWLEVARDMPEVVPRGLPGHRRYF